MEDAIEMGIVSFSGYELNLNNRSKTTFKKTLFCKLSMFIFKFTNNFMTAMHAVKKKHPLDNVNLV